MSELIASIWAVGEAADTLTRACARHGAIADAANDESPFVTVLRRHFRSAAMAPSDMLSTIGKAK